MCTYSAERRLCPIPTSCKYLIPKRIELNKPLSKKDLCHEIQHTRYLGLNISPINKLTPPVSNSRTGNSVLNNTLISTDDLRKDDNNAMVKDFHPRIVKNLRKQQQKSRLNHKKARND